MNYLNLPIRALLGVVTIAAVFTCSCRKEVTKRNEATNNLAFLTEERIKINQAVVIFDSTEITDSIEFVNPPTDKYYEWIVSPNNSCDSDRWQSAFRNNPIHFPLLRYLFNNRKNL